MSSKLLKNNWKLIFCFENQSEQNIVFEKIIQNIINKTLDYLFVKKDALLYINFVNKKTMQQINQNYYPFKKTCDFLAILLTSRFQTNIENPLGEIYICLEMLNQKNLLKKNFDSFKMKFIHSLLHLLEYDHLHEKDLFLMKKISKNIFNSLK